MSGARTMYSYIQFHVMVSKTLTISPKKKKKSGTVVVTYSFNFRIPVLKRQREVDLY